MEKATH